MVTLIVLIFLREGMKLCWTRLSVTDFPEFQLQALIPFLMVAVRHPLATLTHARASVSAPSHVPLQVYKPSDLQKPDPNIEKAHLKSKRFGVPIIFSSTKNIFIRF